MYKKCWQCGEEIEVNIELELDSAYDKGYMQAMRDMKLSGELKK